MGMGLGLGLGLGLGYTQGSGSGGFVLPTPTVIEPFDSLTGFATNVNADLSIAATGSGGSNALRMQATGASPATVIKLLFASADPANYGTVAWYANRENAYKTESSIGMQFRRGSTDYNLSQTLPGNLPDGGIWFANHISEWPSGFSALGLGDIQIRPRIVMNSPFNEAVSFDRLMITAAGIPTVVVMFDDGLKEQIDNALPILTANNIKATFFPPKSNIQGGGGAYMSEANVQTLYALGHEIGIDGTVDDTSMVAKADMTAVIADITTGISWVQGLGIPAPISMCYPFGAFESATAYAVASVTSDNAATSALTFGAANANVAVGMLAVGYLVPANTRVTVVTDTTHVTVDKQVPAAARAMRFIDDTLPFYGDKIPVALAAAGIKMGRLATGTGHVYSRYGLGSQALTITSQFMNSSSTLTTLTDQTTLAKLRGDTYLVTYHGVNGAPTGNAVSTTVFGQHMAALAADRDAGLIQIVTLGGLWIRDGLNPATPPTG